MKLLHRLDEFLTSLSAFKFIIIMTTGMILGSIVAGVGYNLFFQAESITTEVNLYQMSFLTQFIVAIIIAPLIETFLWQKCIIKLLRKFEILKGSNFKIIIISALIFGLQHYYNFAYIINASIAGVFLSYAFVTYEKKKASPFCVVCIIHSLRNLVAIILYYIYNS